ncbi:uncharacterized protein I206_102622 [Kwoniella pini CBS 10737]|uniref:Complex III subunit 9 n=1 Tax=Kwoniella pini CBS 10737 TaxID=1296096 RepID=A0AAJ8L3E6_9TREE
MSRVHDLIYNTFFKRNSAFVATCFVGAFAFQISFDLGTTAWWDYHNRGKQWKDLRAKYIQAGDSAEE